MKKLTADNVDDFLAGLKATCSTSYLRTILGTLRRVIRFAQSRDKVPRNVAELDRKRNGHKHEGIVYVFGTRGDTVKEARNVRRYCKAIVKQAKIEGSWVPKELRHTFVSWMSDQGVRDDLIADLVGHKKTSTTRTVYRHQLRPVITKGAEILDDAFGEDFLKAG